MRSNIGILRERKNFNFRGYGNIIFWSGISNPACSYAWLNLAEGYMAGDRAQLGEEIQRFIISSFLSKTYHNTTNQTQTTEAVPLILSYAYLAPCEGVLFAGRGLEDAEGDPWVGRAGQPSLKKEKHTNDDNLLRRNKDTRISVRKVCRGGSVEP